jgi:hypothetical protein
VHAELDEHPQRIVGLHRQAHCISLLAPFAGPTEHSHSARMPAKFMDPSISVYPGLRDGQAPRFAFEKAGGKPKKPRK